MEPKNAGLNYETLYHMYNTNENVLRRDFARFREEGITRLSLELYWYRIELDTRGAYDDVFLERIRQILLIANEYGLQTMVTFHTLWGPTDSPWCTPNYVIDPVTGNNVGLAIVRSGEMYTAFMDMIRHAVNYLKGAPKWCYAINEPWYWGRTADEHDFVTDNGKTQRENFITLFQDFAAICHNLDAARPATCRFVSHHVGANFIKNIFADDWKWDSRIFNIFDFISFNVYKPTILIDEWRDITSTNIVNTIIVYKKVVWVTELGKDTNDDALQVAEYADMVDFYVKTGATGAIAWVWMSEVAPPGYTQIPGFGGMNLAKPDGTPRPAYYELLRFTPIIPPHCFIATVTYGSPLASELNVLRWFRDYCLPSQVTVAYYAVGPFLAQFIKRRKAIKRYVREVLDLMVKMVEWVK